MPPFLLPRLPAPTASRLTVYTLSSAAAAAAVVLHASATRTSGFAVGVGLAKSNGALMVLGNLAICASLLLGMALQRLFFGRLRPIELEHLYDRTWYFLTESALAFTMFREDFGLPFFTLFGALLGLKCFHWIAADRIDYLDQLASPPRWTFHLRLSALLAFFLLPLDGGLLAWTTTDLLAHGMTGRIIFVSEFAILLIALAGVGGRYAVWGWDQWRLKQGRAARAVERARRREQVAAAAAATTAEGDDAPASFVELEEYGDSDNDDDDDDDAAEEDVWEGKSMVLFHLDLTTDFLKLVVYLAFFVIVLIHAGLPFNVLRDLYLTSRSFITRLRSLIQYRAATRDMEARYADASPSEMAEQGVCIICRDELRPADGATGRRAKRLACGHAFHLRCLRMWLERQQSCPTCRRTVLGNAPATGAPPAPQQAVPAPAPAPVATPPAGQPHAAPPADRALPPNLVRFGDHLAQHPPEPLQLANGQQQQQQQPPAAPLHPTPTAPVGLAQQAGPGAGAGLFGSPNPPQRFAHLFPPATAAAVAGPVAPPAATAPIQAPPPMPVRRRAGVGFELNAFGLELDLRFHFGNAPPPPAVAVVAIPAPSHRAGPVAPAVPPVEVVAAAPGTPQPTPPVDRMPEIESDRTRLLRELSESMTASESAAFTQVLSKVVDDARRTEIGDELARARRFDIREAIGRIAAALHTRPEQISPTAALFPLVLGEVDLELVRGGGQLRLVDPDGTWVLDLATRSTLWLGPDDARLAAGSPSTPPTATSPPAAAESEGGEGAPLDETTMTPREVAARAALRRSARLNPSPPPPTAAAVEASLATSPQQAPGPSPSQIVELEDGSVFFAIPTPGRIAAAAAAPSTPVPGPSVTADAPHPMPTLTPTSTHGRPLVTLTPLERSATASQPLPSLPLPPTLSNAELARLSAETREAIELRLKLIAHFDGVLGPLRADLARVQQALTRPTVPNPPASAASAGNSFEAFTGPAPVAAAAAAASSGDQEPVTRADKGKARAPMDVPLPGGDDDEDDV